MLHVISGPIIAAGETISDGVDVSAGELVRVTMPADWTEAALSFQFSSDGVTYNDMFYIDGFEVQIPVVVPNAAVIIGAHVGRAIGFIKFRSGLRNHPIAQQETRQFKMTIDIDDKQAQPKPSSYMLILKVLEPGNIPLP